MSRLYVRCPGSGELLERVRGEHPGTCVESPSEFASIPVPDGEGLDVPVVREFSGRYGTDVIFLGFSSVTDSFAFTHCVNGRCERHLRFGWNREQGLWEDVAGEAEAWERAAFFAEDQYKWLDPDDPDRAAVEEMHRTGRLSEGEVYPMVDARESARAIAVHYRLTDWLDDWLDAPGAARPVADAGRETTTAAPEERLVASAPTPPEGAGTRKRPWWRFW